NLHPLSFLNEPATTVPYTLSLHDALPISTGASTLEEFVKAFQTRPRVMWVMVPAGDPTTQTISKLVDLGEKGDIIIDGGNTNWRSEEHTSELQSRFDLVCRLLLEKKKKKI